MDMIDINCDGKISLEELERQVLRPPSQCMLPFLFVMSVQTVPLPLIFLMIPSFALEN